MIYKNGPIIDTRSTYYASILYFCKTIFKDYDPAIIYIYIYIYEKLLIRILNYVHIYGSLFIKQKFLSRQECFP